MVSRDRLILAVMVTAAAALRLSGLAWDGWHHQHPDERFLVMVAERLGVPSAVGEALDPIRSPANPNNQGFDFYVYGALPPQVNRFVAGLLGAADYRGLLVVGRVLTILVDMLALLLVVDTARRLGGRRAALAAAVAYGSCPLLLQQSRFATTDTWGVAAAALVAWLLMGVSVTWVRMAVAGAAVGAAVACKPNLVLLAAVPVVVAAMETWRRRRELRAAMQPVWWLGVSGVSSLVAAKILDPGLFAGMFSLAPNPRRLASLRQVAGLLQGEGQFPPALQWADRIPVLEPLATLLGWGTGPLLGVAVLFGLIRVGRGLLRGERTWVPVLVWAVPAAAWHLAGFTCSVRHLEPFLPVLLVGAALWLASRPTGIRRIWLTGVAVWGVAWGSIAWQPHTRLEASRWLAENLPAGAVVTSEYWDDALPLPDTGGDGFRSVTMRVFEPDTEAKRDHILQVLEDADAVVLASQRGVGSIPRVPDAYPVTAEYYHLLFSSALGFDLTFHARRSPGIGPLRMPTIWAEEALSVYDHPPVWVFEKSARFDPDLARRLLERVPIPSAEGWQTRDLTARGTPPHLERWPARGPGLPGRQDRGFVGGVSAVVGWLAALELLALLARAGLGSWLRRLPDGGWGVARALGVMGAGVAWLWAGWLGVPSWNGWLPPLLLVVGMPWGVVAWRRAWQERGFRVAGAVVWSAFLLFLAIRVGNPEVYWGEKPMEAAILTSLWRAPALPPGEPWFAGSPLHYYFFGFLPFGFLGRALDLELGVVFTLAIASIPALAMGSAVSLGWLLSGRARGGVLAAVLVQLVGTGAAVLRPSFLAEPSFNRYWAVSRVIPDTINEFPPWTALFGDLHPHFLAFPGFLAGVLIASAMALGRVPIRQGALLAGAVLGCQAMTNTWEVPALATLAAAAVIAAVGRRLLSRRGAAVICEAAVGAGLVATAVSLPFWRSVRLPPGGVFLTREDPPTLLAIMELFGLPLTLGAIGLLATFLVPMLVPDVNEGRVERRRLFWAWVVVAAGLTAVALPEVITVADRMNSVFKFQLQAHLLLGAGLAGVLAGTLPALPRSVRWPAWGAVALVVAVGLTTSVACARAVLGTRRVPGPRPALDGAAYLPHWAPGMAAVLGGIARLPYGTVVAEPLGPPYSDTLRVPMFTGNPAVVGWEYHLWQRRQSWGAIAVRQRDLGQLLFGDDPAMVERLARRYRVGAVCSWDQTIPAVARLGGWHPYLLHERAAVWVAEEGGMTP